jgi:aspartate carbamoyltransferase catalytic subunit
VELSHVIDARQFDRTMLEELYGLADRLEQMSGAARSALLNGKIIATLFFEPSTRTRLSFESAILRLGGGVISAASAKEFSSATKGETIEDTVRIVSEYADLIVLRHFEAGSAARAAKVSPVPVVSAGDGPDQHPTQGLLDLYTIRKELGHIDGITIAMVGDLANGRTVRSLSLLLTNYSRIRVFLVAPDVVRMRPDVKQHLSERHVDLIEETDLAKVAREADVIYQTRIQKERFGDRLDDYERAVGRYVISREILDLMKPKAIVMHPLPRNEEIRPEVDLDPRAAYFRQAKNGVVVRMALLTRILNRTTS